MDKQDFIDISNLITQMREKQNSLLSVNQEMARRVKRKILILLEVLHLAMHILRA